MPEKWTATEKPWGRGGAVLVGQGKMAKHLTYNLKVDIWCLKNTCWTKHPPRELPYKSDGGARRTF